MRPGFRPLLGPPVTHCHAVVTDSRRAVLCLVVTLVVILMVITIFGMSAWNVYEHRFGENKFVFYSGDEVALSKTASDFSTTFCDSYRVSLQGPGQAYLLSHPAAVNATAFEDIPVNINQLPYRELNYISKYLLEKSTINVTACRSRGSMYRDAKIVLIQGDTDFVRWRRNTHCNSCVLRHLHIPNDAFCDDSKRHLPRLHYEVTSDDKYFLFVFNGRSESRPLLFSLGIFLRGVIARTHFDLSSVEKTCYIINSSTCTFTLPWRSTNDIVVKFEGRNSNSYSNILRTHCQARVIFWVCLFGILPLVCILLTLALVWRFLRRKKVIVSRPSRGCNDEMPGERTRLLEGHNQQLPNYVPQNDGGIMTIQLG